MREESTIPKWALEHIRRRLHPGEEVINAVSFRQGLFRGVVLLNTSRGAALVAKSLVGEPRSALLTYPRDLLTFRCTGCEARNMLVDAEPPVDVHCNHCGAVHHVELGGTTRPGGVTTPSRAGKGQVTKSAPKKESTGRTTAKKVSKATKEVAKKASKKAANTTKQAGRRSGKSTKKAAKKESRVSKSRGSPERRSKR